MSNTQINNAMYELQKQRDLLPDKPKIIKGLIPAPRYDAVWEKGMSAFEDWKQPAVNVSGIPARVTLSELDTSNAEVETAVTKAHEWAERKRSGVDDASIVFLGTVGTGKTHIARSILWSMCYTLDDNTPVAPIGKFFHASDLLMKMNPATSDYGTTESAHPSAFIGAAPIVVIDDVGTERKLPYVAKDDQASELQARYFRVIDYCYGRCSLVITSNMKPGKLAAHLGSRSWDRLNQMAPAGYMVGMFGAPSWRKIQSGR